MKQEYTEKNNNTGKKELWCALSIYMIIPFFITFIQFFLIYNKKIFPYISLTYFSLYLFRYLFNLLCNYY